MRRAGRNRGITANFSIAQRNAIELLAIGASVADVLAEAKIRSPSTVYRWLNEPDFRDAVAERTRGREVALKVAREIAESTDATAMAKAKACELLLISAPRRHYGAEGRKLGRKFRRQDRKRRQERAATYSAMVAEAVGGEPDVTPPPRPSLNSMATGTVQR
jgi:hypothetical protein